MPSTSKKQERFMQAVANNPKFAKNVKVPTKVGKEFVREDELAGNVARSKEYPMKSEGKMMKKEGRGMAKADMQKAMKPAKKMAKGGLTAGHKAGDGMAKKGKTKGMEVKMAKGGKYC